MYFENREEAGRILAEKMYHRYRYDDCAVIALNEGAVLIGEQIAKSLHCILTMLLIEEIAIPGEGINIGGMSQDGSFMYNTRLSSGEIEDYNSEYHAYLDDQKRQAAQRMNSLLGDGGIINTDMIRDRVVIMVSDGLETGSSLDVAVNFLKPIRTKKLVIVTPVSTIEAVDKMHILGDELYVLDVKENFLGTNHYYTDNSIPSREDIIKKINDVILNWR